MMSRRLSIPKTEQNEQGIIGPGESVVVELKLKKDIDDVYATYRLSQEEEREKLLLENIGTAIHQQIETQHKKAKKVDKDVDGTAILKKVEQVTNLIASHIVKGNDLKLLALPKTEVTKEEEIKFIDEKNALSEQSIAARRQLRQITPEAKQKLLETYGRLKEETE
jgi:hypothetical protein